MLPPIVLQLSNFGYFSQITPFDINKSRSRYHTCNTVFIIVFAWINIKLQKMFRPFCPFYHNVPSLWESCWFIMQVFNLCEKVAMLYAEYNLTFKSYFSISFSPLQVPSTPTMTFKGITIIIQEMICSCIYSKLPTRLNTFLILVWWLQFFRSQ